MRCLAIVHEADSGPAMLADRMGACGIEVVEVLATLDDPEQVPTNIDGFDLLLVMGASPSVNDAHIGPWFERELALLRSADANGVPILGVCFGAQALAVALGGSVERASEPEIGWYVVDTTAPELIDAGPWFEWHVDAITPPADATVLATTGVCVQAYAMGPHLAVQFHPEVTDWNVGEWCATGTEALAERGRSADALLAQTRVELPAARRRAHDLVDRFLARARKHTEHTEHAATR